MINFSYFYIFLLSTLTSFLSTKFFSLLCFLLRKFCCVLNLIFFGFSFSLRFTGRKPYSIFQLLLRFWFFNFRLRMNRYLLCKIDILSIVNLLEIASCLYDFRWVIKLLKLIDRAELHAWYTLQAVLPVWHPNNHVLDNLGQIVVFIFAKVKTVHDEISRTTFSRDGHKRLLICLSISKF